MKDANKREHGYIDVSIFPGIFINLESMNVNIYAFSIDSQRFLWMPDFINLFLVVFLFVSFIQRPFHFVGKSSPFIPIFVFNCY